MASGEIRNEQITVSSAFNNDYSTFGAHRARLNLTSWPPGYRADSKQDTGWIKVELEKKMVITAIATQGYGDSSVEEWISRYMVMFSNGGDFMYFKDLGGNLQVCFVLYRLPINSTCTVFQFSTDILMKTTQTAHVYRICERWLFASLHVDIRVDNQISFMTLALYGYMN